jgi:hypothetical protein
VHRIDRSPRAKAASTSIAPKGRLTAGGFGIPSIAMVAGGKRPVSQIFKGSSVLVRNVTNASWSVD